MGLFSSSNTSTHPPPPIPSADGAFIAPDRQNRRACWRARDDFFACLERNNIVDSIRESGKTEEKCSGEGRALEKECVASWVSLDLS